MTALTILTLLVLVPLIIALALLSRRLHLLSEEERDLIARLDD